MNSEEILYNYVCYLLLQDNDNELAIYLAEKYPNILVADIENKISRFLDRDLEIGYRDND